MNHVFYFTPLDVFVGADGVWVDYNGHLIVNGHPHYKLSEFKVLDNSNPTWELAHLHPAELYTYHREEFSSVRVQL